jgi:hypothetical protein
VSKENNVTTIILTIPEISALMRAGDERSELVLSRLGIGALSDEVAQAGVSSLFARGLLDNEDDAEIAPTQVILAALGLIAGSTSTLRLAVVGEESGGTSHVHVVGDDGVLVTPIGFGCFHFSFIDASEGAAAFIKSAGEAALDRDDRVLLVSVRTGDSENLVAVRRTGGSFELSDSETGTFVLSASPWDDVAAKLAA